jgi:5-hydroxyisourate hydrolase
MSGISTHILDTAAGLPAEGVPVRLFQGDRELNSAFTDKDGRCTSLLPSGVALAPGTYRILFEIGSRFPEGFYPEITVTFAVRDSARHHHVPLLVSPFGFTTYRGS